MAFSFNDRDISKSSINVTMSEQNVQDAHEKQNKV